MESVPVFPTMPFMTPVRSWTRDWHRRERASKTCKLPDSAHFCGLHLHCHCMHVRQPIKYITSFKALRLECASALRPFASVTSWAKVNVGADSAALSFLGVRCSQLHPVSSAISTARPASTVSSSLAKCQILVPSPFRTSAVESTTKSPAR